MNRRRSVILVTMALLCLVVTAIYFSRRDEIYYHGKSLSRWLEQLDDQTGADGVGFRALPARTQVQIEAADAIRAMGTNALPRLMHDLSVQDAQSVDRWVKAQRYIRERILHLPRLLGPGSGTPARKTQWKAALAMEALGPRAESALPQLAAMANMTSNSSSCKEASFILAGMGPAGIAILTNYPPSPNSWRQFCAIWAIGQHPQSSSSLVPWLLDLATNPPPSPASGFSVGGYGGVIWALGEIHAEATLAVPFLIKELTNTNSAATQYGRSKAVLALGRFGKEASNAVPILNSLKDNPSLRALVEDSLKKINSDSP